MDKIALKTLHQIQEDLAGRNFTTASLVNSTTITDQQIQLPDNKFINRLVND